MLLLFSMTRSMCEYSNVVHNAEVPCQYECLHY